MHPFCPCPQPPAAAACAALDLRMPHFAGRSRRASCMAQMCITWRIASLHPTGPCFWLLTCLAPESTRPFSHHFKHSISLALHSPAPGWPPTWHVRAHAS